MKKLSDKTIRQIIVVVGIAISVVLIVMIGSKFKKAPVTEAQISQQSSETNDVVVVKPEITVPPITTSEKIDEDTAILDRGTEQKNQKDVVKPEYTEDQLTDPTKKPTGEEVEPPTKDGEIYVPGFGWIEDEGGGGEGIEIDGDGDINKPVGIMD